MDSNVWDAVWYCLALNVHLNGNTPSQWGSFAVVGDEITMTCTNGGKVFHLYSEVYLTDNLFFKPKTVVKFKD